MAGNPLSDPHWAKSTADTVERLVTTVRDRTTSHIVVAARAVVFGLLGAIVGLPAIVLLLVALTRGLQAALEWPFDHDTAVWLSYLIVGGILTLAGAICMTKRHTPSATV
ncbi:MAG: hypothetical protein WAS51_15285 [Ilumatobacteraceae bacterium]|nr:MAG: hypothetical protein IPM43_07515 [Actinomycetota bacterium]